MNIKKIALVSALIAGLSLGCMPQAQASAGHTLASTLLTTAAIGATGINVVQNIASLPVNQFLVVLALAGVVAGVMAELPANTAKQHSIKEGIGAGLFFGSLYTALAVFDAFPNINLGLVVIQ